MEERDHFLIACSSSSMDSSSGVPSDHALLDEDAVRARISAVEVLSRNGDC